MRLRICCLYMFFVAIAATFAHAEERPLYGQGGRKNTEGFMKREIEPHIKETLDHDNHQGKFFGKTGEATELLTDLQEKLEEMGKQMAENPGVPPQTPQFEQHKYFRGTDQGEIDNNHLFDYMLIVGDQDQFYKCMDYEIIGICVPPGPVIDKLVPYVKYYGPPQKVENVDQPFKSGYLRKEDVEQAIDDVMENDYYDMAAEIALDNLWVTNWAMKNQAGGKYADPGNFNPTYAIKAVDDLQNNFDKKKRHRYLDPSALGSGYVYNDYHVMPTGVDMYSGDALALAMNDPIAQLAMAIAGTSTPFVHISWLPGYFYSESPDNFLISRWLGATWIIFDALKSDGLTNINLIEAKWAQPFACQQFNAAPGIGRFTNFDKETAEDKRILTPSDMLTGLVKPGGSALSFLCQGGNQASWLPFLNTIHTALHTTAAAVGTVRGIKAALYYSLYSGFNSAFYDFTYDNPGIYPGAYSFREGQQGIFGIARDGDKVQWSRGELMDGPPAGAQSKPCNPIEKWVLNYGDANMKKVPEDHWAVTIQWRYWRGCLGGGFPIYPPVPQVLY